MQEWDVVGVIAVLVALFSALTAPLLRLTQAIAKLTVTVEHLEKNATCLTAANRSAHEHLWEQSRVLSAQIGDHESRIRVMEEN